MAKIFGIEIKNVKSHIDHEGCQIHSGNIYLDGKRIGSWEDSYMAGPAEYDIPEEDYNALVERADRFYDIYTWTDERGQHDSSAFKGDPDVLIGLLVEILDYEKSYKKCLKNGYTSMILITGEYGTFSCWQIKGVYDDWETRFQKQINTTKEKLPKWVKPKIKYIKCIEDFDIPETTTALVW